MNPFGKKKRRLQSMRVVKDEIGRTHPVTLAPVQEAFSQCPSCNRIIATRIMRDNGMVCPSCGHYLILSAPDRLRMTFDQGRYFELNADLVGCDPLDFPGYADKLKAQRTRTGLAEAVVCAVGCIGGRKAVAAVLDSRFLMGSMGTAVGEKITRAIEYATRKKLPLVIFSASGGARMQEGIFSLMQMAKTSAAVARHDAAGLLFVSVMTHPTTGGVTASFASLGDVIISEPHALIGFAGPRVIEQTIGQKLPEGFQRAESLLRDGFLDAVVERRALRDTLIRILEFAERGGRRGVSASDAQLVDGEMPEFEAAHAPVAADSNESIDSGESPERRLALARDAHRPHADELFGDLLSDFFELHGDRRFSDDGSILGGIGRFRGMPVMAIGQLKGHDVQSNIACNFGMPQPEGYRKVERLARLAGKFHRPIITFIDTPGAYPGIEAEQRGQAEAIASCLATFSLLSSPVVAVVVGEGGSGGALALGMADSVIMLENAVYAVLSPEGFAAILWKDRARAPEACRAMKITAADLIGFKVADRVIPEGPGGAQCNRRQVTDRLGYALAEELTALADMDEACLVDRRYRRFRAFGDYASYRVSEQSHADTVPHPDEEELSAGFDPLHQDREVGK